MPVAIDVGQRVLVYNPSHGWTLAYFVTAQKTNDNKLQILVSLGFNLTLTKKTKGQPKSIFVSFLF